MSKTESKNGDIYFISGSKGGVGKSFVANALIDYLRNTKNDNPFVVDTDTSNPDVYRAYSKLIDHKLLNLDVVDGWMALVDLADSLAPKNRPIVVSTGSRNNVAVAKYGQNLVHALEPLNRRLVVFWVIDRNKDALRLLHQFVQDMPQAIVHVVINEHFGEQRLFQLYADSEAKQVIEARGGKSIPFPDVADRVADAMRDSDMPIEVAIKELPLGNRVELQRWRGEATKALYELTQ